MKTLGFVLLALVTQGCFFHHYYKDSERKWSYFEDWDTNQDSMIDKNEFATGFERSKMIDKIKSKSQSVNYSEFDSLVVKISRNSGEKIEEKPKAASLDIDGDQKLSEPELAAAMFVIADDNKDNELTGLEFYVWEVYL